MKRTLLLLFVGAVAAFPQFSAGVKAGVPLTDFFDTVQSPRFGFNSDTKRYVIGPMVELRLPAGFGVEFDALYRRLNYDGSGTVNDVFTVNRTRGNAWEFPLLLKYRFPTPVARPYVEIGPTWNTLTGMKQSITNTVRAITTTSDEPLEQQHSTTTGLVVGAGLEVRAIFLRISPEIRYTRWGSEQFRDPNNLLRWNRNQAEFLLGITF